MPWYETPDGRGFWGSHWTGFNAEADPTQVDPSGRRDVWSNYYPLIEPYDSIDPFVLECQLLQMKLAGIDGVIADWYGLANATDYPLIHEATEALFTAAGEQDMLFAACFEDRTVGFLLSIGVLQPTDVTSHLASTFAWMQSNWFSQPQYLIKDGRPVLLNFGPISVTDGATWDAALAPLPVRPYFFALHNLWTLANADGAFMWVHWSVWDGNPTLEVIRDRLAVLFSGPSSNPDLVIPSAVPGFDDVYEPPMQTFPFLDYRGGDTFREALSFAVEGPWPIVQLPTWNDYGEGTMIEPTREFGYLFLEIVQEVRRDELGAAFPYTASDLRLPSKLLTLRRLGGTPSSELDAIAAALRNGDTQTASEAIQDASEALVATQPASVIVDAGQSLSFTVAVAAAASQFSVTWSRDGVPLADGDGVSGSASTALQIASSSPLSAGVYTATVSFGDIAVESASALGAVRASPLGASDVNNDGLVDTDDATEFITLFEAASSRSRE